MPDAAALRFGHLAKGPSPVPGGECFTTLLATNGTVIRRIASRGRVDPPGAWYDQAEAEFVLLVAGAARLGFADGTERTLGPGDWVVLPAGCRHRVAWTDPAAETLWLAVHLPASHTTSAGAAPPDSNSG